MPEIDNKSYGSRKIWPYRSENEAVKAAEQYVSLKTPAPQRRTILERLLVTDDFFKAAAPIVISSFSRADMANRHAILDHIGRLIVEHNVDFSDIATDLAKIVGDPNFQLREKASKVAISMGARGSPAIARILGHLRSKIPDIQENALKVISAMGPSVADQALPKVQNMLNGSLEKEVRQAAKEAVMVLTGDSPPLRNIEATFAEPEVLVGEKTPTASKTISKDFPYIHNRTILIIDDEPEIRRMIVQSLAVNGAQTLEASNGREAKVVIDTGKHVDLILLDLMMPQMNGIEFLKLLRESPVASKIPVYIITARGERQLLLAMAKLEISGYFIKPFKIKEILVRVNETLEKV